MNNTISLSYIDEDTDDEVECEFPAKKEVCPRCEGHGSHLNPSIGDYAYSMEEFYEAYPEDEDRQEYFKRGGIYDVCCYECHGQNVISVVDESRLTDEQKKLFELCEKYEEKKAQWDAEDRATYRAESGYRG